MTLNPFLALLAVLLFIGCGGRTARTNDSVSVAVAAPVPQHDAQLGVRMDSMVFGEGCEEYTGYFREGSLDRKAAYNIRRVIFDTPVTFTRFGDCTDTVCAGRYRAQLLDSIKALAWLDTEPWVAMGELFRAWSEQQFNRDYIVFRTRQDPFFLYECNETDSVLVRCADILTRSGDRFVDEVRRYWQAGERAKAARDSITYDRELMEYIFARIAEKLQGTDSTYNAAEFMFQTVSNHINNKIHKRLGREGTVDFNVYADDFIRLFDSVKLETWEP